jgi:hypothetical protein
MFYIIIYQKLNYILFILLEQLTMTIYAEFQNETEEFQMNDVQEIEVFDNDKLHKYGDVQEIEIFDNDKLHKYGDVQEIE